MDSQPLDLTDEQAELLRANRYRLFAAAKEVSSAASLLADACPHVDPEQPDTCQVCQLYRAFADASNVLHEVPGLIDFALSRGPAPASRRKSPEGGAP